MAQWKSARGGGRDISGIQREGKGGMAIEDAEVNDDDDNMSKKC